MLQVAQATPPSPKSPLLLRRHAICHAAGRHREGRASHAAVAQAAAATLTAAKAVVPSSMLTCRRSPRRRLGHAAVQQVVSSSMEKGQQRSYRNDVGMSFLHVRPLGNATRGTPSSDDGCGSRAAAEDGVITRRQRGKKLVQSLYGLSINIASCCSAASVQL